MQSSTMRIIMSYARLSNGSIAINKDIIKNIRFSKAIPLILFKKGSYFGDG